MTKGAWGCARFLLAFGLLLTIGKTMGQIWAGEVQITDPVYPGYGVDKVFTDEGPDPIWILEVPVRPEYKHVPGTQTPNNGIWVAFFPGGCGVGGYFICDVAENPSELSFQ